MAILDFFRKKENKMYTFTDEDRELSSLMRKEKYEILKTRNEIKLMKEKLELEKAKYELEELKQELYGEEEEDNLMENINNPEMMLISLFQKVLTNNNVNNNNNINEIVKENKRSFSLNEIKGFLSLLSKDQIKLLKKLNTEQKKELIKKYIPEITQETEELVLTELQAI